MIPNATSYINEGYNPVTFAADFDQDESKTSVHQTLVAAVNLLFQSELSPDKVMDLIPMKPIGDVRWQMCKCFKNRN